MENDYTICEECIGLVQFPDTKAQTIFTLIRYLLIRCFVPLPQCRGQAFDGAANTSGKNNGVYTSFSKERGEPCVICALFGSQSQFMYPENYKSDSV